MLEIWTRGHLPRKADSINLQMNDSVGGSSLLPQLRLYGRDGLLLNATAGASTAQITRSAPASGFYTIVLGDAGNTLAGRGSYNLIVNGLSNGPKTATPQISGTN